MSELLATIRRLVGNGEVLVSQHGRERLAASAITTDEIYSGVEAAKIVEEYVDAWKGPTILLPQQDTLGRPLHVLWGLTKNASGPAVLVTAYRPDPRLWTDDFKARKR